MLLKHLPQPELLLPKLLLGQTLFFPLLKLENVTHVTELDNNPLLRKVSTAGRFQIQNEEEKKKKTNHQMINQKEVFPQWIYQIWK